MDRKDTFVPLSLRETEPPRVEMTVSRADWLSTPNICWAAASDRGRPCFADSSYSLAATSCMFGMPRCMRQACKYGASWQTRKYWAGSSHTKKERARSAVCMCLSARMWAGSVEMLLIMEECSSFFGIIMRTKYERISASAGDASTSVSTGTLLSVSWESRLVSCRFRASLYSVIRVFSALFSSASFRPP